VAVTSGVFHVNASFAKDGFMTTSLNGEKLTNLQPYPSDDAKVHPSSLSTFLELLPLTPLHLPANLPA